MRTRALAAALLAAALAAATGCATRTQPYRFASPLLGVADVPPPTLPGSDGPRATQAGSRAVARSTGRGWQADTQAAPIRVVSARGIEARMPEASEEAAAAIAREGYARGVVWSQLPAPHRDPTNASLPPPAPPREPADLRALIGTRDKRAPFEVVASWLASLAITVGATDGPSLVEWADANGRLGDRAAMPAPGDLLVFDRATSEDDADLVAIVVARDARGVTEFMYPGGGVIRRGFYDPTRPSTRRDLDGAIVNTFLRHGKQWPPKGTRYLAAELLGYVIRAR